MNPRFRVPVCLLAATALSTGPLAGQAPPVTEGLKVHLDAGEIAGLADGATVTDWPDSAVGLVPGDAAQNASLAQGAGAPTLVAADPLFGGRPSVAFGGADALRFTGSLGLAAAEGAQAFTIFIVATNSKAGISPGFSIGDVANGVGDGSGGSSVKCDLSTSAAGLRFNDGNRLFTPAFSPTTARIGMFRMGVGDTYGESNFRSDNRASVQSSVTNAGNTLNFLDEGYYVGAGLVGGSGALGEFANGHIAEILFYNRELSDAQANAVGYHLEQKYGLDTDYFPPPDDGPRPNIVVFLSDDHTWRDSSLYGSTEIETPNLDRVAALGMTFNRAYVNSPACAPARAALLTGLYPARNGAEPNHARPRADIKKLPAYLQELGYEVVSFGKVGHYAQTSEYGFDIARHFGYHEDVAIPNAVQWLEERQSEQPLCIIVGTNWPHVPWPQDGSEFPTEEIEVPPHHVDTPGTRLWRSRYLAAVRTMDDELGMVFDAAHAKFGGDFFFLHTSDHGAQWPFAKWNLYEDGIRTPFIATWPGVIEPGSQTDALVSWVDILPTLVDVAGGPPPSPGIDGLSVLPVLRGETTVHREHIFATHSGDGDNNVYPMRSVSTTDGWKYIRNLHPEFLFTTHITNFDAYWQTWTTAAQSDPHALQRVAAYQQRPAAELYDLASDPWELDNLIDDPAHAARAAELADELDQWMLETGDTQTVFGNPTRQPPPPPASLDNDLFVDTFNRPTSTDADASAAGMSGSRVPPMGAANAYYEGFEGSGSADSIRIFGDRLQIAVGNGMAENGLMHNFVGQDIIDAGGFSVEMTIVEFLNSVDGLADRYAGFGVGLSEAEAAAGGDISGALSFRGSTANPTGKADFFIDLDGNGNLKVWSKGQLLDTVPVGASVGTITAKFALDGFSTVSTVEVGVFFNGQPLDINTADPDSATRTFSWDAEDTNYIGLSARASGNAGIDNLAIRKLPLAESLAVAYALGAGLQGSDTAPGADPDGDGRTNFVEWAFGTDPSHADAGAAPVTPIVVEPGQSRFRFEARRLSGHHASDVSYVVMISSDLESWQPVDATVVSQPEPVPGRPGYESVELELPGEAVAGQDRLFVLIAPAPAS